MEKLKVKFKKDPSTIYAKTPIYSREGDACLDLFCSGVRHKEEYIEYSTGIAFEIPEGYVGLIYPRSSITKKEIILKNSVGVIDPNFRGYVTVRCMQTVNKMLANGYRIGERCAQIRIVKNPKIELIEAKELSETNRGNNGYGSSGN